MTHVSRLRISRTYYPDDWESGDPLSRYRCRILIGGFGMFDAQRVLVTGGAGFIGSHLCDRLLQSGHEVLCVDNFYSSTRSNVEHLLEHPRLRVDPARRDISALRRRSMRSTTWPAPRRQCTTSAIQSRRRRLPFMGRSICLAWPSGPSARILLTSTSEIYGDPEVHPQREGLLGSRQPDRSASALLRRGQASRRDCSSSTTGASMTWHQSRPSVQYLRSANASSRWPGGIKLRDVRIARQSPSRSMETARRRRSFCYVDDLVEGLLRMMAAPHAGHGSE